MVLNRKETRESVQFSNESAGYLVCSGCDGFYELQEDETPEDFDKCECGSPLVYYKTREELENRLKSSYNAESAQFEEHPVEELVEKPHTKEQSLENSSAEKPSIEKISVEESSIEKLSARESAFEKEISNNENSEKTKSTTSTNKSVVDRLSPQTTVSDDVLANRRQGKDFWDNLDDLNSKNNHQAPQASADHSIEMDRLMVMVDHKRTFKEKEKGLTPESSKAKSPIMIIGAIILIVIVLALTMVLGIF